MSTFTVDLEDLRTFATEMRSVAGALNGAGGTLPVSAGSGAPTVEDALGDFRSKWSSGFNLLCQDLDELAVKLQAAVDAYDATETQIIDATTC